MSSLFYNTVYIARNFAGIKFIIICQFGPI